MTQTQSNVTNTPAAPAAPYNVNAALADALADTVAYYDALAEIGAQIVTRTQRRDQIAEHARQTEAAWERAFAQGWGEDLLASF